MSEGLGFGEPPLGLHIFADALCFDGKDDLDIIKVRWAIVKSSNFFDKNQKEIMDCLVGDADQSTHMKLLLEYGSPTCSRIDIE